MEKLLFPALRIDGRNYTDWIIDVEVHLTAKRIQDTIYTDVGMDQHDKAQALVILRHHLVEPLKHQYKTVFNPRTLWDELKSRFEHITTINLPNALQSWVTLRVQDFKTVDLYNSEMFRITSELRMCGEPVSDRQQIEKTLATFHPTNLVISNQYRNMAFMKYSQLIAHMLLAEQNSILLMNNAKERPLAPSPHLPHQIRT